MRCRWNEAKLTRLMGDSCWGEKHRNTGGRQNTGNTAEQEMETRHKRA